MQGLAHLIYRPREIVVTDSPEGLESMEVNDAEGRKQIVTLMKPLSYPRRIIAA